MTEQMPAGAGRTLAQAREARGLSQADVADKLKLTSRQIEALEADEYDKLPAMVFVRGFIRNYARLVGLDAEALVQSVGGAGTVTETITAPSEGVTITRPPLARWLVLLLGGLGIFLLLVALLYTWLKRGEEAYVEEVAVEQPVEADTADPLPARPVEGSRSENGDLVTVEVPIPALDAGPAPAPAPGQATVPAVPSPGAAPTPAESPGTSSNAPRQPAGQAVAQVRDVQPEAPVKAPAGKGLHFTAGEDSWVQVVDGDGRRYSKLIPAGGTDTIAGRPPFRIVVGNAASVRMSYNGQGIDLQPFTGQRVARLTLE